MGLYIERQIDPPSRYTFSMIAEVGSGFVFGARQGFKLVSRRDMVEITSMSTTFDNQLIPGVRSRTRATYQTRYPLNGGNSMRRNMLRRVYEVVRAII